MASLVTIVKHAVCVEKIFGRNIESRKIMTIEKMQAAYEHNGLSVTAESFYEIACNPQRNVVVEACAGSGKTWILVSRMLRALLDGCSPHEILAITFTRKAAGEMRERLLEWLLQFATADHETLVKELVSRGVAPAQVHDASLALKNLYEKFLQSGRQIQIRTFHSWFSSLIKCAPLAMFRDLGLPTTYELLEDDEQAIAQVWSRFYTTIENNNELKDDYWALVKQYGQSNTTDALTDAIQKRVEFTLADSRGVVASSVQRFQDMFSDFSHLNSAWDRLLEKEAQDLFWQVSKLLGQEKAATPQKIASALKFALSTNDPDGICNALLTKKKTPLKVSDKIIGVDSVYQAQDLVVRCLQASLQEESYVFQQRMTRLSRALILEFSILKNDRGWLDMGDLELVALRLLSDPCLSNSIQERLDAQIRHVLIDEFQDTSPLQWHALYAWLSSYSGAGRAPSIFIVGDPKQSIYRFRRADPQVFKAAKDFVKNGLAGDMLSCDHTRRNGLAIRTTINTAFDALMAAGKFEGFRQHTTASSVVGAVFKLPQIEHSKEKSDTGQMLWRDSLTTPRENTEEDKKAAECRQAAQWIANFLRTAPSGIQAGDIMVLARKRNILTAMNIELNAIGIGTQQSAKIKLIEQSVIRDVVDLLSILISPTQNMALARVLKSPIFLCSDEDLILLAQADKQRKKNTGRMVSWYELLQTDASIVESLKGIGVKLNTWKHKLKDTPIADAISDIYLESDIMARYCANVPEAMRLDTIAQLATFLQSSLGVGGGRFQTPYALINALKSDGIKVPVRAQQNAIQLLTVHGAKGLEAKCVIVLDTDANATKAGSMTALIEWPGEMTSPKRFIFIASETNVPLCTKQLLEDEIVARQREENNALYVAMTRAREYLVISSTKPHHNNENSWWNNLKDSIDNAPLNEIIESHAVLPENKQHQIFISSIPTLADASVDLALHLSSGIQTMVKKHHVEPTSAPSIESRIGQAMHKFLEWSTGAQPYYWSDEKIAHIQQQFSLSAQECQQARSMTENILHGKGGWAWSSDHVRWASNEVRMSYLGHELRIDRLLCHAKTGEIWVLDYKSSDNPHENTELCAQLNHYCAAVQCVYPDHTIRGAFLSATGDIFFAKISDEECQLISPY
jgi:ATP-dependent helicase/nuclease subunit A